MARPQFLNKIDRFDLLQALPILAFLGIWQLLPSLGGFAGQFVVPPTEVAVSLWDLLSSGALFEHAGISFRRALAGFFIASLVGIPAGFLLGGWFRGMERAFGPTLEFLSKLNPFSLFPLFVMLLGIGEISKTAIVFWVCVWPILFSTVTGITSIDRLLIRAAQSMGCSTAQLFFKVIVPAAAPSIFTGLKMGSGGAFFILIAAEMIGASRGLGWLVWNAQMNFLIPQLFAATVSISLLGLALNNVLSRIENHFLRWRDQ